MAAMPEANATALPDSSPPTTSSSASQVGVPSSREYSRPVPIMKFDAGISGTFSGAPGSEARPAETSHDSGLILNGSFSTLRMPPDKKNHRAELLDQMPGLPSPTCTATGWLGHHRMDDPLRAFCINTKATSVKPVVGVRKKLRRLSSVGSTLPFRFQAEAIREK